jgi:predicted amidohydrolase
MPVFRVAAVQTTAGPDRRANLEAAATLVERAASDGAALVVLPEYFSVAGDPTVLRGNAETLSGPTVAWSSELARRLGIRLVAGSFPERIPGEGGPSTRLFNTSCLIGPDGSIASVYRKIHLFDVRLGGGFRESDTFTPGDRLGVSAVDGPTIDGAPRVAVGLSLCYDLRFPEMFGTMALRGATAVAVPAAFTATTGPAHWELLLRARAVENQVFMIGAGQVGQLPPGMPPCHGHSMIVDPWGTVIAERVDPSPGVVVVDLDLDGQAMVRDQLPVLAHRRPAAYR